MVVIGQGSDNAERQKVLVVASESGYRGAEAFSLEIPFLSRVV
jgi:hypothetical protein